MPLSKTVLFSFLFRKGKNRLSAQRLFLGLHLFIFNPSRAFSAALMPASRGKICYILKRTAEKSPVRDSTSDTAMSQSAALWRAGVKAGLQREILAKRDQGWISSSLWLRLEIKIKGKTDSYQGLQWHEVCVLKDGRLQQKNKCAITKTVFWFSLFFIIINLNFGCSV